MFRQLGFGFGLFADQAVLAGAPVRFDAGIGAGAGCQGGFGFLQGDHRVEELIVEHVFLAFQGGDVVLQIK